MNLPDICQRLFYSCGVTTPSYNLGLPLGPGFAFNRYQPNEMSRLNTALPYVEIGRYAGGINTSGTVQPQLYVNGTTSSGSDTISGTYGTGGNASKAWVYRYIRSLETSANANYYTGEITDSSIRNRVLCNSTAFLALETSDTVQASVTGNSSGGSSTTGLTEANHEPATVKAYPNPFTDAITISFETTAERIEIFDISGKRIRTLFPHAGDYSAAWDGRDEAGSALPGGIYLIRIYTAAGEAVLRVLKR